MKDSSGWIIVVMAAHALHVLSIASPSLASHASDAGDVKDRGVETLRSDGVEPPSQQDAVEDAGDALDSDTSEQRRETSSAATTIQEKYRLPDATWRTPDLTPHVAQQSNEDAPDASRSKTPLSEPQHKVTRAEYDQVCSLSS